MISDKELQRLVNESSPAWHRIHTETEGEASVLCNAAHQRLVAMACEIAAELLSLRFSKAKEK